MRVYEYTHTVGFEDTNLVGNVYYLNHLRWQGRCREMFLRDHAPSVLADLRHGLALVTVHCSCDYLLELLPFDDVVVRMTLGTLAQSHFTMNFEYFRGGTLVARGMQHIACMRRLDDGATVPTGVPEALRAALA
jgi:enediyne core biosynthesis thioesterase